VEAFTVLADAVWAAGVVGAGAAGIAADLPADCAASNIGALSANSSTGTAPARK
jgi:hypothetical protein